MDLKDLEEFQQAIELAEANNREEAHLILERLRRNNPDNSRILLCYIFTSNDPAQAKPALATVAQLDPLNPSLAVAQNWLASRWPSESGKDVAGATPVNSADFVDLYRANPAGQVANDWSISSTFEMATSPGAFWDQAKLPVSRWKKLRQDWQLWLGALLLGLAAVLLISQIWPAGLTEPEKEYWQAVRTMSEQTNQVNQRLLALGNPKDSASRQELLDQLKTFDKLNQQFRQLNSPSIRFDKLDSNLGLAYNYFSEGAAKISQGLANDDQEWIRQGNLALLLGNDYLHKARQESEQLGLH